MQVWRAPNDIVHLHSHPGKRRGEGSAAEVWGRWQKSHHCWHELLDFVQHTGQSTPHISVTALKSVGQC